MFEFISRYNSQSGINYFIDSNSVTTLEPTLLNSYIGFATSLIPDKYGTSVTIVKINTDSTNNAIGRLGVFQNFSGNSYKLLDTALKNYTTDKYGLVEIAQFGKPLTFTIYHKNANLSNPEKLVVAVVISSKAPPGTSLVVNTLTAQTLLDDINSSIVPKVKHDIIDAPQTSQGQIIRAVCASNVSVGDMVSIGSNGTIIKFTTSNNFVGTVVEKETSTIATVLYNGVIYTDVRLSGYTVGDTISAGASLDMDNNGLLLTKGASVLEPYGVLMSKIIYIGSTTVKVLVFIRAF